MLSRGSSSYPSSYSSFIADSGASAGDAYSGIHRAVAELLFDPQQLVVLRGSVAARGCAASDLPATGRDREVGDRRVLFGLRHCDATSQPCNRSSA